MSKKITREVLIERRRKLIRGARRRNAIKGIVLDTFIISIALMFVCGTPIKDYIFPSMFWFGVLGTLFVGPVVSLCININKFVK